MEKKNTHITYGLLTGAVSIIVGLILYLTNLSFKPGIQYVSYIPFLIGVVLNAIAFSKANDGYVTFANVFGSCFKASMIISLVIVLWSLVAMYIFPEMKEKIMTAAREQMLKNPKITDEQADMSINMMKKYWTVLSLAGGIFYGLFFGALFSLVGAGIAKKKGAPPIVSDSF
jgi:hypothetical protein